MYETGHRPFSERDDLRHALNLLEKAISRHGQHRASIKDETAGPAELAFSRALQMMREEADALRSRLAA